MQSLKILDLKLQQVDRKNCFCLLYNILLLFALDGGNGCIKWRNRTPAYFFFALDLLSQPVFMESLSRECKIVLFIQAKISHTHAETFFST